MSTTCKVLGIKAEHVSVPDLKEMLSNEPAKYTITIQYNMHCYESMWHSESLPEVIYMRLSYKRCVDNRYWELVCDDWIKKLTALLRAEDETYRYQQRQLKQEAKGEIVNWLLECFPWHTHDITLTTCSCVTQL